MSSILDALKKLEEEKAARKAVDVGSTDPETPLESFEEIPRSRRRQQQEEVRLSNKTILLLGGGLAVALVAVSVTVSLALMRSTAPAQVAMAQPAAPVAAPVAAPTTTPASAAPAAAAPLAESSPRVESLPPVAKVVEPAPKPKVEPKAEAPKPKPAEPKPAETKPEPAPRVAAVEPEQHPLPESFPPIAPAPVEEPAPAPAPAPEPEAAPEAQDSMDPKDVAPVADVKELPVLRTSDRISFGLENMRVNFLREATPNRPAAMAVINLNKIHIGEVIPGTKARLVAVEREGIGIEITDSGKRFYVPL